MLPFSLALQRTGGVDLAANAVVGLVGNRRATSRIGDVVRHHRCARLVRSANTATAVQMAPVALAIANDLASLCPIRSR